jgi:hypothetical protein
MIDKDKMFLELGMAYDEIYHLERERVELNCKIHEKKRHLFALLNNLRPKFNEEEEK